LLIQLDKFFDSVSETYPEAVRLAQSSDVEALSDVEKIGGDFFGKLARYACEKIVSEPSPQFEIIKRFVGDERRKQNLFVFSHGKIHLYPVAENRRVGARVAHQISGQSAIFENDVFERFLGEQKKQNAMLVLPAGFGRAKTTVKITRTGTEILVDTVGQCHTGALVNRAFQISAEAISGSQVHRQLINLFSLIFAFDQRETDCYITPADHIRIINGGLRERCGGTAAED